MMMILGVDTEEFPTTAHLKLPGEKRPNSGGRSRMAKRTIEITWSESVTYTAVIEVDVKEDEPVEDLMDDPGERWFEEIEKQLRPDWRQQIDEVEHRQILSFDVIKEVGEA
jgi:hypothetical protein